MYIHVGTSPTLVKPKSNNKHSWIIAQRIITGKEVQLAPQVARSFCFFRHEGTNYSHFMAYGHPPPPWKNRFGSQLRNWWYCWSCWSCASWCSCSSFQKAYRSSLPAIENPSEKLVTWHFGRKSPLKNIGNTSTPNLVHFSSQLC